MKWLSKISVLALFTFAPFWASPTCIVIWKFSKNRVFISADSRQTFSNGEKETICKIHRVGNVYFAFAGHGDNFTAEIVDSSHFDKFSYTKSLAILKSKMIRDYTALMNDKSKTTEENFQYYQHNALVLMELVHTVSDSLQIDGFELAMKVNKQGRAIVIDTIRRDLATNHSYPLFLGIADHLQNPTPEIISALRSVSTWQGRMRKFVEIEMSYHPNDIAEPIDILELNPNGKVHWYSPQRCPF